MKIKDIQDSAKFANFTQRCKVKFWEKHNISYHQKEIAESLLDDLLLIAWHDINGGGEEL